MEAKRRGSRYVQLGRSTSARLSSMPQLRWPVCVCGLPRSHQVCVARACSGCTVQCAAYQCVAVLGHYFWITTPRPRRPLAKQNVPVDNHPAVGTFEYTNASNTPTHQRFKHSHAATLKVYACTRTRYTHTDRRAHGRTEMHGGRHRCRTQSRCARCARCARCVQTETDGGGVVTNLAA